MTVERHVLANTNRRRVVGRRDFFRTVAAAGMATGALGWLDAITLSAAEMRRQGMSCILLWMDGGPSQFETFSPLPGHANGGETRAISTSVPGIQIADNLPNVAGVMDDLAIIRSMTSKEGSHPRASFLMHHGYLPMGSVKFPTLGANVAQQIGDSKSELPSFVRVGGRARNAGGGGLLGVDYDPLVLGNASRPPQNTRPTTNQARYERRLKLLGSLESDFAANEGTQIVADHRKVVNRAAGMILSPEMTAFDIEQEPAAVREAYGESQFGAGCLLARRLIESGVTFVEVVANGWDTHQDNFAKTRELSGQIDRPMAQLIVDLKQRGMLEKTLVIWMGEFGRSPQINARAGRDHFPRAFNVALAGGGIRGGQVIGRLNESGTEVAERPVTVNDLFRSVYHALGIDADYENYGLGGRPIKLVDGGEVVTELFS